MLRQAQALHHNTLTSVSISETGMPTLLSHSCMTSGGHEGLFRWLLANTIHGVFFSCTVLLLACRESLVCQSNLVAALSEETCGCCHLCQLKVVTLPKNWGQICVVIRLAFLFCLPKWRSQNLKWASWEITAWLVHFCKVPLCQIYSTFQYHSSLNPKVLVSINLWWEHKMCHVNN